MSTPWPKVRLGEVLRRADVATTPDPEEEYAEITVRLWGKGVTQRGMASGATMSGRRFLARAGQIIASRIDARHGAIGLVPAELDGALVTNDFPLFDVDATRLDPSFLEWLSRTAGFVRLLRLASEGTTNRVRLKEERFAELAIPLPPLPEQRRIVARIEALASRIEEAKRLRQQAAEEAEGVVRRCRTSYLDEQEWDRVPLGTVLAGPPRNGLAPHAQTETGGYPMLRINAVSSAPTKDVDLRAVKNVAIGDTATAAYELQPGDVFIVRYNGDINRVAKPAVFRGPAPTPIVYPDKLMRLRPRGAAMTPEFLVEALQARSVRAQIEELGKTTAGNIGVSGADAKSLIIPVPPLGEQQHIVASLDALQAKVDALKGLQSQAAAELDALLPSVLDRAFRGVM